MNSLIKFKKWLSSDISISNELQKVITMKLAEYIELNSVEVKPVKRKTRKSKAIVDKIS